MAGAGFRGLPIPGLCPLGEFSKKNGNASARRTKFEQGSRQNEQDPTFAAMGRDAPRWPGDGRCGEVLLSGGR
jgi:hypothetical protein